MEDLLEYFDPYVRVRSEQLFQVGQYGMGKGADLVHQHDLGWRTGLFKDTTHKTKEGKREQARIKATPRYNQMRNQCLQKLDELVVELGLAIEAPKPAMFQQIRANPQMIAAQTQVASDNPAGNDEDAPWSDTASDSKAEIKVENEQKRKEIPADRVRAAKAQAMGPLPPSTPPPSETTSSSGYAKPKARPPRLPGSDGRCERGPLAKDENEDQDADEEPQLPDRSRTLQRDTYYSRDRSRSTNFSRRSKKW